MPTFGFDKSTDDIEPAVLMPEDWYNFEITKDPEIKPNAELRDMIPEDADPQSIRDAMEENEKAGMNLVINLESEHEDDVFTGRGMTLWLPWPSTLDHDRYDRHGQKVYDAKMQAITEFTEAFGGSVNGENITLQEGLKGMCFVIQQRSRDSEAFENRIDMFQGFKEYGS